MPALQNSKIPFVKTLLLGDSGAGKTGALVSLVAAGYRVRILDLDNKVATGILPKAIMRTCPEKIGNVDYISFRDKKKASALGPIFDGVPQSFTKAMEALNKWEDGSVPAQWGPECVFVLDSLTFLGDAAFNWAKAMSPGVKDPRQWFYTAQQAVEDVVGMLTSEGMRTNVIVICHVSWSQKTDSAGVTLTKGYPASIGKALDNTIPAYFDNMILAQASITTPVKRTIQTAQTSMVDLKNPASFSMLPTLPLETGLATFFEELKK
jgi:hypothetical protein